ncbi:SoxR reducing system RseC family protein [Aeromonas veronii]|uniref:SoxR reducing system RseC family protein n=1 Tax=Aeromonas veronii TaxID=654 RepID=UPI00191F257E|nr:SoxR reducing system RseC family protein [Aeromonas veronii]MBL0507114.1 SoxR reducing system RseC family protein [Aeromonas veronii]
MSEELATVVAIEGDHAWVECERRSACSGCQQQSNCGTGTVAKAFPLKAPRLRVRLTAEVRVGQQVRLGIPQESLLRGAALVYVLPLFCLLACALLGQLWLTPLLSGGEGITILCCLLGGVLGFLLVRYFSNRLDQGRYGPQMLGVVVPVRILP